MINGRSKLFYGALAVVSADNLGSLALGGFKESCSAERMCRHCMATGDTARKQVGTHACTSVLHASEIYNYYA